MAKTLGIKTDASEKGELRNLQNLQNEVNASVWLVFVDVNTSVDIPTFEERSPILGLSPRNDSPIV